MKIFNKILIPVEINSEPSPLIEKAKELLSEGGEISLAHVETVFSNLVPIYPMGGAVMPDMERFQQEYHQEAQSFLRQCLTDFDLPKANAHLLVGKAASEIKKFAKDNAYDLIVIGLHEEQGVKRILGTTANGVLHGAPCDVLSVLL